MGPRSLPVQEGPSVRAMRSLRGSPVRWSQGRSRSLEVIRLACRVARVAIAAAAKSLVVGPGGPRHWDVGPCPVMTTTETQTEPVTGLSGSACWRSRWRLASARSGTRPPQVTSHWRRPLRSGHSRAGIVSAMLRWSIAAPIMVLVIGVAIVSSGVIMARRPEGPAAD